MNGPCETEPKIKSSFFQSDFSQKPNESISQEILWTIWSTQGPLMCLAPSAFKLDTRQTDHTIRKASSRTILSKLRNLPSCRIVYIVPGTSGFLRRRGRNGVSRGTEGKTEKNDFNKKSKPIRDCLNNHTIHINMMRVCWETVSFE